MQRWISELIAWTMALGYLVLVVTQCHAQPTDIWTYDGETSGVVSCVTTARTQVDLVLNGQTYAGRLGNVHTFQVGGLTSGETYSGQFLVGGQAVGSATLNPHAAPGRIAWDGSTAITAPGRYVLTRDVDSGITIQSSNVTLDLDGHTVAYSNQYGINQPDYNRSGISIFNGTLRESGVVGSQRFPIFLQSGASTEIAGVSFAYQSPDTGAIYARASPGTAIHHNVVTDLGTGISNRHAGVTVFGVGSEGLNASYNLVEGARHLVFNVQGNNTITRNELGIDSWATNAGGLLAYGASNVSFNQNWVYGTGEHVVAMSFTGGGNSSEAIGNTIVLDLEGPIVRSGEYGDRAAGAGIRSKDGSSNLLFRDNNITLNLTGQAYGVGSWIAGSPVNDNIRVEGGFITVNATGIDDDMIPRTAAVNVTGNPALPGPHIPVTYSEITIASDLCNVSLSDPYGVGQDALFENVTLVRTGDDPRYETILAGYAGYDSTGHEFVGTVLEGGAGFELTEWMGWGDVSYTVVMADGSRVLVSAANPYPEPESVMLVLVAFVAFGFYVTHRERRRE